MNSNSTFRAVRATAFCVSLVVAAGASWAQQAAPAAGARPAPPPRPSSSDVINSIDPNPDAEAQAKGNYPSMAREALPLGQIQRAFDDAPETAPVRVVTYSPERVEKLRAREFMSTTVIFPSWEVLDPPTVDDEFAFEATLAKPNILVIRARHVGADTSVTAISAVSGNVYSFYVRGEGYNTKNVPDLKVYVRAPRPWPAAGGRPALLAVNEGAERHTGGSDGAPGRSARDRGITGERDPDFLAPINFDPAKLRYDFEMSGDRSLAPQRVFTDGVFTWFDYADRWDTTDLPAVYRVVDGVDTPINTRVQGHMLVAEASGAFTLRNGQRTVCVRPDGFVPEGAYAGPPDVKPLPAASKASASATSALHGEPLPPMQAAGGSQ